MDEELRDLLKRASKKDADREDIRREFKEYVAKLMKRDHGLLVTNEDLYYHQHLQYNGLRTMLVVPWPGSRNYAVNDRDLAHGHGHHYRQVLFARLFYDFPMKRTSICLWSPKPIGVVSDLPYQPFQKNKGIDYCRVIHLGLIEG